ncbi:MAG TPA: molybdate ABC transporter substrate-binding protein [Marmoricola sp.]|nr:molybdate ABC transporter substrate-binding protein [Marmoricola sp.]
MRRPVGCVVLLLLASCGSGGSDGQRTLDVLAAASLTGAFERLAADFEDDHPGVDVRISLGSSATLARQVVEGAPADVLATADERTMQVAADGGGVTDPVQFATNEMVLVTTAANPAGIRSIEDLEDTGYVVCVETAPCGVVAAALLERNEISNPPLSYQSDVKAVEQLVLADEVDAGLVYASDAAAHPDRLLALPVPGSAEHRNPYLVAVTEQSDDPGPADAWVELLTGDRGRAVLAEEGFEP